MSRASCSRASRPIYPAQRALALVACLALAPLLLLAACNQEPARAALAETEQALAAARPDLERYAPAELARIGSELEAARARFSEGRYTGALRVAQKLPGRVALAVAAVETEKQKALAGWTEAAERARSALEAVGARVAEVDRGRAGRTRPDAAARAALQEEVAGLRARWSEAEAARSAGDVASAARLARDVDALASALLLRLGPGAVPSRTGSRAESAPAAADPDTVPAGAPPAADPPPEKPTLEAPASGPEENAPPATE